MKLGLYIYISWVEVVWFSSYLKELVSSWSNVFETVHLRPVIEWWEKYDRVHVYADKYAAYFIHLKSIEYQSVESLYKAQVYAFHLFKYWAFQRVK